MSAVLSALLVASPGQISALLFLFAVAVVILFGVVGLLLARSARVFG